MPREDLALARDRPQFALKLRLRASRLTTLGLSLPVYENATASQGRVGE